MAAHADRESEPQDLGQQLALFAEAIEQSPHNLMSKRGLQDLRTRHLPECLAFATLLPRGPARLLDLGSGGGLPGMVIALARPDLTVHLVEATGKKAAFLEATAGLLGVEVVVHTDRAESLALGTHRASFDLVTARAVASLDRLIPWAMPLLKAGGSLFAIKGERWREELDQATQQMERAGAYVVATPDDLPRQREHDPLVVVVSKGH